MINENKKAPCDQKASLNNLSEDDSTRNKTNSSQAKYSLAEYPMLDENDEVVCKVRIPVNSRTLKPLIVSGIELTCHFFLMSAEYLSFLCGDKPRQLKEIKRLNDRYFTNTGICFFNYNIAMQLFGTCDLERSLLIELRDCFVSSILKPTGEPIDD